MSLCHVACFCARCQPGKKSFVHSVNSCNASYSKKIYGCQVLWSDHIVHLKDGSLWFGMFYPFFCLLQFSRAKEFNVLHGLPCIPCIHPSSCAQINLVNTFLFYVFFYAGILNCHDFKVFIPNKTCTNEMLYHSASCVFSHSVGEYNIP